MIVQPRRSVGTDIRRITIRVLWFEVNMGGLFQRYPFSYYLIGSIFLILLLVVGGVIAVSYLNTEQHLQDDARTMQEQTEDQLIATYLVKDAGLRLYDESLNKRMEEAFTTFLAEYEKSGRNPANMDLERVKAELGGEMELYIINKDAVIEYTTYAPEKGLDFRRYTSYFPAYLEQIRNGAGFYPDRIVSEISTGKLKKFAYMPTPDHRFVLELGLTSPAIGDNGQKFRTSDQSILNQAKNLNPYIKQIRMFDTTLREKVDQISYEVHDPVVKARIASVIETRASREYVNTTAGEMTRYLFIDLKDGRYGSDKSLIVELVYDTAKVQRDTTDILFSHLFLAAIALLISLALAIFVSRRLTRPVRGIVADVDRIAGGDLDHTISPTVGKEFSGLEESINTMVGTLNTTITKLADKEKQYRSVVEDQNHTIIRVSPDGTYLFVNRIFSGMLGKDPGEIVGQSFLPRFAPDDGYRMNAHLESLTPEHPSGTIVVRILRPDGVTGWWRLNTRATFGPDRQPLEYQMVGEDNTEQKYAEEALIRITKAVESSSDAIGISDPQGTHLYQNQAFTTMFGYTVAELNKPLGPVQLFADADEGRRVFDTILRGDSWNGEIRMVARDGREFQVALRADAVKDDAGSILGLIGIHTDITERIRTEEELVDTRNYLNKIINSLADPVLVKDRDFRLVLLNDAFCTFIGRPREELLGKTDYDLFPPREADVFREKDELVFRTGRENVNEEHITDARGGQHTIVAKKTLYRDTKGSAFIVAILSDITKRSQMEQEMRRFSEELEKRVQERTSQLQEANKDLESFCYSISHDLRAPLRAISGYSSILIQGPQEHLLPESKRYLEMIQQNAHDMGQLIDDLLKFSRMGRTSLEKERVEPARLAREVIAELRYEHAGRNVTFSVGTMPPCHADPRLLHQVYLNLISNALKFTRSRDTGRIEIGAFTDNHQVVYFVRDNGVGFDMRYAGKVFGVFQRLHPSGEYEGTGVGLAIVQRIIELHEGRIWVESAIDKGTTFFFTCSQSVDEDAGNGQTSGS
jgi:PAS domain S-box-containing protein